MKITQEGNEIRLKIIADLSDVKSKQLNKQRMDLGKVVELGDDERINCRKLIRALEGGLRSLEEMSNSNQLSSQSTYLKNK